jgi:UDP-N-acetylmuramoylalanine--D-glutamate ligase
MPNTAKIIIWGMGITGQACAEYLIKQGKNLILIDRKDPTLWLDVSRYPGNVITFSEDQVTLEIIKKYPIEYILASPGIDLRKGHFPQIREMGIPIMGDIEFVFLHTQTPIIAVTGTNGKSTTVNMIKSALELAGKKVFLGGNWGIPAVKALENTHDMQYDWLVLETSSFQLELTKTFAPAVAVITNITMSHAERYDDFHSYLNAKLQIINCSVQKASHVVLPKKQRELFYPHLEKTSKIQHLFDTKDLELFDFSKVKVLGPHNLENFSATYQVLKSINLENRDEVMQKLIDTFSGIPHRLERVGSWHEVYFYNDSKSTNIEATKTALSSFSQYLPHHPIVLILGGKLRSDDVSFLEQLKGFSKIALVLSFGEAAQKVNKQMGSWIKVEAMKTLSEIIIFLEKHLRADTQQKLILLFSPSFPSFDQYKNFEHRGEMFKQEVQALIQRLPKES